MKVAHFSTYLHGGAATAARRLHRGLLEAGVDSRFHHVGGVPPDGTYRSIEPAPAPGRLQVFDRLRAKRLKALEQRTLQGQPDWVELFTSPRTSSRVTSADLHGPVDVLHLHWVAQSFDYERFFRSVPDSLPIVWTQHDMNVFTGGCHYSWGCRNFERGCGNCFQLGRPGPHDFSRGNARLKQDALAGKNIHVVANSRWIEGEARSSAILAGSRSFRTIHYGLDHGTFAPRDRAECRARLGIDGDAFVLAFGSDRIDVRRKGLEELTAALRRFADTGVELLVFGHGVEREFGSLKVHRIGPIGDEATLASVYSTADAFVIPSLHEAFGQTALEAMACGIPVVGFATGGIVDMVDPGVTGLLARQGDTEELAVRLSHLRDHPDERHAMGAAARARVEREFTLAHQARRYLDLYGSLI